MGLVNDDNSEVRLNALKAITCLSEAPEGRRNLLHHVDQVRHDHLHSDLFSRGYATLHLAMSVGRSVGPSITFEFQAVFALLLLPNRLPLRLDSRQCRVTGLVLCQLEISPESIQFGQGREAENKRSNCVTDNEPNSK